MNYNVVDDTGTAVPGAPSEEICYTITVADDGTTEGSLSVLGFSLDEAKCTTLEDGSLQYEFPDGTMVTIVQPQS